MRLSDLQKVWVGADAAATHAYLLWNPALEEAYLALRAAAARVLTERGHARMAAKLRSNSTHNTTRQ